MLLRYYTYIQLYTVCVSDTLDSAHGSTDYQYTIQIWNLVELSQSVYVFVAFAYGASDCASSPNHLITLKCQFQLLANSSAHTSAAMVSAPVCPRAPISLLGIVVARQLQTACTKSWRTSPSTCRAAVQTSCCTRSYARVGSSFASSTSTSSQ